MRYFTVEQEQQKMYTQLPKALLYEEKYKPMSNDSKVLYSFLVDRVQLSLVNNYTDELGRVYIKCSEITMSEILNKSEKTVRRFKKELMDYGLLEQPNAKEDKTKYYVMQPEVTVEKLTDYIGAFQEVVNERVKKEIERNKEYRKRESEKKIARLLEQKCNGKNDRSIENTDFENDKSLKPLQSLATVVSTDCDQSKLPFSNTNTSNTDISMYVCTGEPTEQQQELLRKQYENENFKMLSLVRRQNLLITSGFENYLKQLEEDNFDYELFEQLLYSAINKRVNNLEGYLFRTINNLRAKGVTNRYEYDLDVQDYVDKNYRNGKLHITRNNTTKPSAPVQEPVATEPVVEEIVEPVTNSFRTFEPVVEEVIEEPKSDVNERVLCLQFRQQHNLTDTKYFYMSLDELKVALAERNELLRQAELLKETYNKDLFSEQERKEMAMRELGLV